MRPASTPNPTRRPARRTAIVLAALLTAALICCLGLPYAISRAIRAQLDAESRLHSTIVLARACNAYALSQTPPRWPTSWQELESVRIDYDWLNWPQDADHIREHATVDFTITLDEALAMPETTINAIRPSGNTYPGWQSDVWHALRPAREALTIPTPPKKSPTQPPHQPIPTP